MQKVDSNELNEFKNSNRPVQTDLNNETNFVIQMPGPIETH